MSNKITFEPAFKGKSGKLIKSHYTPNGELPKRKTKLPVLRSVKDLKEFVAQLPDSLPLRTTFSDGVQPKWYNIGDSDEHLAFEEAEDFDEDEENEEEHPADHFRQDDE